MRILKNDLIEVISFQITVIALCIIGAIFTVLVPFIGIIVIFNRLISGEYKKDLIFDNYTIKARIY